MSQHTNHVPPTLDSKAFNCPQCRVFARQSWFILLAAERLEGPSAHRQDQRFQVSYCASCGMPTIWTEGKMVYPQVVSGDPPNPDLPPDIKRDYEEARLIANNSPRGAAALLRLAIQKLCKHLGKPGKNINDDIKALVADGLPATLQQALDTVRVIGNEAVHPGSIDLRDDVQTALKLFKLVNFICQKMITEPREVAELYGTLPPSKRAEIQKRDA